MPALEFSSYQAILAIDPLDRVTAQCQKLWWVRHVNQGEHGLGELGRITRLRKARFQAMDMVPHRAEWTLTLVHDFVASAWSSQQINVYAA